MPPSSKTGSQRGGRDTAPKTTARRGTAKSAAARADSHVKRSTRGGASNQSMRGSRTGAGEKSSPERTRRGPGAMDRETGRAQSSAGKQNRGTAPKRAK